MPNTSPDLSCTHANIAPSDLEEVVGGAGLGFPAVEAAQTFGDGLTETIKQRQNIRDAITRFNNSGWNPVFNFSEYMKRGRPGEGRWEPPVATENPDGSINQPKWIKNGE